MVPYFVLVCVPLVLILQNNHMKIRIDIYDQENIKKYAIDFFFLIFLLMLCFRSIECGNDLSSYLYITNRNMMKTYTDILHYYPTEWGYHLFNRFFYSLFGSYQIYIALVSLITIIPVWLFYRKECKVQYLAIILFMVVGPFSMYFSGLRQAMAMAFAFPAFYLAKNKKILWFLVIVVVATMFHTSAFILIGVYPMCVFKITKKWLWFVLPIMGLIFAFNRTILIYLMALFGDNYTHYDVSPTGAYGTLIILVSFAILSYLLIDESKLDQTTICLRNLLLISVCLQCFAPVQNVAMRFNYYYLPFVPVLLSRIIPCAKGRYEKDSIIIIISLDILFIFYFFYRAYAGEDIMHIFPYVPFWR